MSRPSGPKIVVVGGLNMDLMIETPRLARAGETAEGTRFYTAPGGKGGNQAVAAARLVGDRGQVEMVGLVGEDAFGTEMIEMLQAEGVSTRFVRRAPGVASGIAAIFIDPTGQNYVNPVYGANSLCSRQQVADATEALDGASVLLVQQEVPLETTLACMKAARSLGVTVILDPAPVRDTPHDLPGVADIVTPNQGEAEQMTGVRVSTPASAARAGAALKAAGARSVIVKLGDNGAHVTADEFTGHLTAFDVEAVATVAAGDAFNGGLAVGLASGMGLLDAAWISMAAGALCVTRRGAQESMPTRVEVERLLLSAGLA